MRTYLPLLLFLCTCACGEPEPVSRPEALEDGVYEVLAVGGDRDALPAADADARVLTFDRQFIAGGAELAPEYVLLRVPGHAPLELAQPPTEGEANGRPVLLLSLKPEAAKALTALTSKARRAAVVVDGTIVTVHGIRVPIEGGLLQVSC